MSKPHDTLESVLHRMAADPQSVTRPVRFANDDVPRYIERLRRFQESSRKMEILIR